VVVGDGGVEGVGRGELPGERLAGCFDRVVARSVAVDEDAPALGDPELVVVSDLPLEAVEGSDGGAGGASAALVELASVAWT
jgi:hypothetical protein